MSAQVKILFFAKSREIVGKNHAYLDAPNNITYDNLLKLIIEQFSLELIQNNIILAVNEEFSEEGANFILKSGDEVAVIPPLSGDEAMQVVTAPNCGAVSLFVGTTRDNFEGKKVMQLEYEAYESMAYKSLKKLCTEMRDKWKALENVAIHHRLGIVPVAEASVVIAISSPHRSDSLEATQWCIDTLKKTVPIWKKEVYEQANPEWKENSECHWSKKIKELNSNKTNLQLIPIETKVPSHLIQINCSTADLNKRIQNFMERKRQQVNMMNVRDFCGNRNEDGCARTASVLVKQKNSKTHLKVARVFNPYGPRSNTRAPGTQRKWMPNSSNPIEERLQTLENTLTVKPVSKDIYARLKKIEDRMLELEAISPEYAQFWNKNMIFESYHAPKRITEKQKYSVDEIDRLLLDLESKSSDN